MALDSELEFAAGLLLQDGGASDGPSAGDDVEVAFAAAILAPELPGRLGLPRRSSATAAYARVCRALKSQKEKTAELAQFVENLRNRCLSGGPLFLVR